MRSLALLLTLGLAPLASAQPQPERASEFGLAEPGLYAVIETSQGNIVAELFPEQAPVTVQNFVDLALGRKAWRAVDRQTLAGQLESQAATIHSREEAMAALDALAQQLPVHENEPFYDGTIFHRVIPGFMIQGGAPRGIANPGAGAIGYTIPDEFSPELRHDRAGRLSMANAGPGTGGSQFFVTVAPTPHLDDRHTIFGQVVQGQEVADAITQLPRNSEDRPAQDVVIEHVIIIPVGAAAEALVAGSASSQEATATPASN